MFLHNKRQLGPGHRRFMIHYRIILVDGKQMTRDTAESNVCIYESIYKSSWELDYETNVILNIIQRKQKLCYWTWHCFVFQFSKPDINWISMDFSLLKGQQKVEFSAQFGLDPRFNILFKKWNFNLKTLKVWILLFKTNTPLFT